ncbi:hypothetical protein D9M70_588560 [compost metagenome]
MHPHRDVGPAVLDRVGQRLLRDPVEAEARRCRQPGRIALLVVLDGEAGVGHLPHQRGDIAGAGQRVALRGAVGHGADRLPDVAHRAAADLLGVGERGVDLGDRLGGLVRPARLADVAQRVPRAGDLE